MAKKQAGAKKQVKQTKEEKGSEVQAGGKKPEQKVKENAEEKGKEKGKGGIAEAIFRIIPKQNLIASALALIVLFFAIGDPNEKLQHSQMIYGDPKGWHSDKRVPSEANFSMDIYPSEYTTELDVKSFYEKLMSEDANKTYMVVFFDPWSKDYRQFGGFIDKVAKRLKESAIPDDVAEVCMVNAGVNNYLLNLYAAEQFRLDTWQEDPEEALYSFRFGKPNYFPMVVTMFKNREKIATYPYTGHGAMLTEEKLFNYISYHIDHWNVFEDEDQLLEYRESKEATIELCGYNAEGCDPGVFKAFNRWGEFFRGEAHFVVVENEALCHEPCAVSLYRKDLVREITFPTPKQVIEFIRSNKANFLTELTEKKGAHLEAHYDYMCILLIDVENQTEWIRAERAIWHTRELLIEQHNIHIGYVWGPHKFLVEQFGLQETDGTSIALYRFEDRMYTVLKDANLDHMDIVEWLEEMLFNPELVNRNYFSPEEEEEAERERLRTERDAERGEDDRGERRRYEDDEEERRRYEDDERRYEDDEEERRRYEDDEEEKDEVTKLDDIARELNIPWYNQIINEDVYKEMDFEDLWTRFRNLLLHYMQFETIYANLPSAEKAKERAFRTNLNRFRKFLKMDPDGQAIQPLVTYLPVNAHLLESKLEYSKESRRRMLRSVERFSGTRMLYRNKIEMENDEDFHRRLYRTAHLLNQIIVETYLERSQEFMKSPEYDPKQTAPKPQKIDRREGAKFTYREFLSKYASKGIPVIITNVSLFKTPLTLERLSEKCGSKRVDLKYKGDEHTWAGLSDADDFSTLAEFIQGFATNETLRKYYLHDWSLPHACPKLLGLDSNFDEFIMPKFFAGDYFQRMPYNQYENSWPSLFVGAKGTESMVHIDSGGTNFWLHLVSGEKKWRVFDKESIHDLYLKPGQQYFYLDVFRPDVKEFPLFLKSKMYEFTQKPGELVFIPGDSPHAVVNTDDIVAISSNYMDDSNRHLYLWHSLYEEEFRRFELYTNPYFPVGLDLEQTDLNFGDFKSRNWFTANLDKTLHK